MSLAEKEHIASNTIMVNTNQKRLQAAPRNPIPSHSYSATSPRLVSAAPGPALLGGVLGGLLADLLVQGISNIEVQHVEEAMQPVYKELNEFDIEEIFKTNLYNELKPLYNFLFLILIPGFPSPFSRGGAPCGNDV